MSKILNVKPTIIYSGIPHHPCPSPHDFRMGVFIQASRTGLLQDFSRKLLHVSQYISVYLNASQFFSIRVLTRLPDSVFIQASRTGLLQDFSRKLLHASQYISVYLNASQFFSIRVLTWFLFYELERGDRPGTKPGRSPRWWWCFVLSAIEASKLRRAGQTLLQL